MLIDKWSDEILDELVTWLKAAYPNEGCALILATASGELRVKTCENLADKYHAMDPETFPRTARTFYMLDPMEFVRAEDRGDQVAVIVHSHADVGDYFSDEDVAAATLPRDADESLEPSYPDTDYLVVSVRDGVADHATLFRFSAESQSFPAVLTIDIDGSTYTFHPTD